MFNASTLLFTNVTPTSKIGKIIQFPLLRILIVIIFLLPVTVISYFIDPEVAKSLGEPYNTIIRYGRDFVLLIMFMILYGLYTRLVERRSAHELSLKKFYAELGVGAILSFIMVGSTILLMVILGYYKIVAVNPVRNLTDALVLQMMVGFTEELAFRLVLFKLVEEFAGSWIAILVQGLLFGFAHIWNTNATVGTSLAIVISGTLLFGGAFMLTRRIWLIMGIHWSWNFLQAGVFGMPNSGSVRRGWFESVVEGPEWITGGAWGIEASAIVIIMGLVVGVYIFRMAVRNGQLVQPAWVRRKMEMEIQARDQS